jgi:thiamine kinase-like enzyme
MDCESIEKIKENIYTYLSEIKGKKNPKLTYDIIINRINEITNSIFEIRIYYKTTNELYDRVIYKKFSKISKSCSNKIEQSIFNSLSKKGFGPKILYIDPNHTFRIEECSSRNFSLKKNQQFQSDIIEQIIQIIVSYSLIANIFSFTLKCDDQLNSKFKILINALNKKTENDSLPENNFFDMCFKDLYLRSLNCFKQFGEKFRKRCIKCTNKTIFEEFQKLEFFMNNFKLLFKNAFPEKSFMVLNHNDFGKRKIIVLDDNKVNVIENDFSSLNLIGFDFVNYLNESVFNYIPNYEFNEDELDLDDCYLIYLKFINKFEEFHSELKESEEGKKILDEIKSKNYYLNLHCLINIFWVLHCSLYLNHEKFINNEGFNYFNHAIDRIKLYEKISEKKDEEEEKELSDDEYFDNDNSIDVEED